MTELRLQNGRSSQRIGVRCTIRLCVVALAVLVPRAGRPEGEPPAVRFTRGVLIRFEGPITPLLEQFSYRKLDTAKRREADVVIVEIDSPGGFLDASLNIADRLRNLAWARTVAFVPREALSGAAIAALGCDEIIMSPEARLGDAGPIFQGEDALFRHAPEKIRSVVLDSPLPIRGQDFVDAIGVDIDMPATPEKVWRALQSHAQVMSCR